MLDDRCFTRVHCGFLKRISGIRAAFFKYILLLFDRTKRIKHMTYSDIYSSLINLYGRASSFLPFGWALPPIRASIEITYKCNLKCKMCFQVIERKENIRRAEMSPEEIKKIIDQMPPQTLITLTGGEPFSRNRILEIISHATRNHRCNLVTNGTMISQESARHIVKSGVMAVGISLDGTGELHDSIRGIRGAFEKTITGIQRIQDEKKKAGRKFPLIDVKMVVLQENISHILDIYNLCQELSIDFFTVSALKGSAIQLSPPILDAIPPLLYNTVLKVDKGFDVDLLSRQLDKILEKKDAIQVRFYPGNLSSRFKDYYTNRIQLDDYFPCYSPWMSFNVSPYGEVFPCLSLNVGNIKEQSLRQIWNGQKMRDFRRQLKKNTLYQACHGCCNLRFKKK
jgi:MoaA/NifB/PqqE/SkfB family radical SAM enzyme